MKLLKPLLNTVLFVEGSLDGLQLSIEHRQRIVICIEAQGNSEVRHVYELGEDYTSYHYKGIHELQ